MKSIANIPVLIICFLLFTGCIVFVLPGQKTAMAPYARKAKSPGLMLFPKPDTVYRIAEAYGEVGRQTYTRSLLVYDFVWPLVYGLFYSVFIAVSLRYVHGKKAARLGLAALLPMALDWGENLLAIILFARFPERMDAAAWAMAALTCLKWITMGAASLLFAYGLLAAPARFAAATKKANPIAS